MNRILIGLALLTTCVYGTELQATVVSIDDFTSTDQMVFAAGTIDGFDEETGSSSIGRVRAISAGVTSTVGSVFNLTGSFSGGNLDISTVADAAGETVVTWDGHDDGVATSAILDADLLMGGSNDRFRFDIVSSDPGTSGSFASLVMKVSNGTGGSVISDSSATVSLDSIGFVDILFSSFTGIDFSDVTQLDMIVTLAPGSNVAFDSVNAVPFDSVKAVPVPSNLTALASLFPVCVLGLIVSRRRRNSSIPAS